MTHTAPEPGSDADPLAGRCTEAETAASGHGWVRLALTVAALAGAIDFWGARFNLNPDGISYLELAQHALLAGPHVFINGYWSPGYPVLLAPILRFAAAPVNGIPALHIVNFLLYLIGLALFCKLCGLLSGRFASRLAAAPMLAIGIVLFSALALQCIGVGLLTPDMAVLLIVMAMAICALQIERDARPQRWAVALGVVAGIGYWMKGIMLPLGLILLILLLIRPPRITQARRTIALAVIAFAIVTTPLVVLLSSVMGRFSIGEVGKLNYAWEINDVTSFVGWTGDTTLRFGAPVHPPRVLRAEPRTLEFATPIHATYPLWYDPAYWYDGVRARFDATNQRYALERGFINLWTLLVDLAACVLTLGALWAATESDPAVGDPGTGPAVLLAWSACAVLIYAAVHVEPRYLAGFVVLIAAVAWSHVSVRSLRRRWRWVVPVGALAIVVGLGHSLVQNTGGFEPGYRPQYLIDGDSLRAHGVRPGDAVAAVGDAFEQYAAFAAGAWISAQVMDSTGYWELSVAGRDSLDELLSRAGARAVLANNVTALEAGEGWILFPHSDSTNVALRILRSR